MFPLRSSEILLSYYQLEDMPELFSLPLDIQRKIVSMLPNPFRPLKIFPERVLWTPENPKYNNLGMNYVFSHDESHVAISYVAANGQDIVVLVSLDGTLKDTLRWEVRNKSTDGLLFSPDDTDFFCLREGRVEHVTLNEFKQVAHVELAHRDLHCSLFARTPQGHLLAASRRKLVYLVDPTAGTFEELHPEAVTREYAYVCFISPNCSKIYFLFNKFSNIQVFDVATRSWSELTIELGTSTGPFSHLCLTRDGKKLLIKVKRMTYVWDLEKQELVGEIEGTNMCAVTPDSKFMVAYRGYSVPKNQGLCFYSIETGAFVGLCNFEDLVFSPSTRYFLAKTSWAKDGPRHIYLYKTHPLWYELARDFVKPVSCCQYFFICFLHALHAKGVTLTNEGLAAVPGYATRVTVTTHRVTQEHIAHFKEIFSSFSPTLQKYLLMKYSLRKFVEICL